MHDSMEKAVCTLVAVAVILCGMSEAHAQVAAPGWMKGSIAKLETELVAKHGEAVRADARRGMEQVAQFWRVDDGGAAVFEEFVLQNFAGDEKTRDGDVRPLRGSSRQAQRAHDRDRARVQVADRSRYRPGAPRRRDLRRIRSLGSRRRRFLPEQDRLRRSAQLSAHHARSAPHGRRAMVAAAVGGGPSRPALLQAHSGGGQSRGREDQLGGRPVHLRLQRLDASPRRREGEPALPRGDEAPFALEPSRRAQGGLSGREERARQAAHDTAGDGTHRHPDDSGGGRRQSGRRLEPVHERGETRGGEGLRGEAPTPGERHEQPRAGYAVRDVCSARSRRRSSSIPIRRRRLRSSRGASTRTARFPKRA